MARPLRIQYPGALYHVTVRGNGRHDIFYDAKDKTIFLNLLADITETHNIHCYAYCLMDNHFHLLIETPDANLSRVMRDLNGEVTQAHNKRYDSTGHLFQGRYKAFLIEKELYLLAVARYIVLNPVRAKMVRHPRLWRWSSYRATAGEIQIPNWLSADSLLEHFCKQRSRAQKLYRDFVTDGISAPSPFDEITEGVLLGSQQFINDVWGQMDDTDTIKDIRRSERIVGRPTLKELFSLVTTQEERDKNIVVARLQCGYLNTEIGRHLHLDGSTIGKIVKRERNSRFQT